MEIVTDSRPDMHSAAKRERTSSSSARFSPTSGFQTGKWKRAASDANLIYPFGSKARRIRPKTEIKNLTLFRAVYRGTEYEIERQIGFLERRKTILQETRAGTKPPVRPSRSAPKRSSREYRYFLSRTYPRSESRRNGSMRFARPCRSCRIPPALALIEQYGLPPYDAAVLTQTRESALFFEEAARTSGDPKAVSNWMMADEPACSMQLTRSFQIPESRQACSPR